MHNRRVFPKGPKQEILYEPEMPPIPVLPTVSNELETATLSDLPYLEAVQMELKPLEDLPTAKLAGIVIPPKTEVSLTELDEAANNMQMPEK